MNLLKFLGKSPGFKAKKTVVRVDTKSMTQKKENSSVGLHQNEKICSDKDLVK